MEQCVFTVTAVMKHVQIMNNAFPFEVIAIVKKVSVEIRIKFVSMMTSVPLKM